MRHFNHLHILCPTYKTWVKSIFEKLLLVFCSNVMWVDKINKMLQSAVFNTFQVSIRKPFMVQKVIKELAVQAGKINGVNNRGLVKVQLV